MQINMKFLYIKIKRCGIIANETTIHQSSNELDVSNSTAFNNKKNHTMWSTI